MRTFLLCALADQSEVVQLHTDKTENTIDSSRFGSVDATAAHASSNDRELKVSDQEEEIEIGG